MSKHGRYMGEDVTKLPMHKRIDKNGKVIHGYKYYDHGIQIYKDIDIFLKSVIYSYAIEKNLFKEGVA